MTDPSSVSFTVKEMFADVSGTLHRIEDKLDGKADRAAFDALAIKVETHEIILQRADATRASAKATWATVISVAGLLVSLGFTIGTKILH